MTYQAFFMTWTPSVMVTLRERALMTGAGVRQ
jgi:hypothetical protein